MDRTALIEEMRQRYFLDGETESVILGPSSAIDLPSLCTDTFEKAHDFVIGYGFDPNDEAQERELAKLRADALDLIEQQLLDDPDAPDQRMEIPEAVLQERDVRKLMVMASTDRGQAGRFACSVLRIMHTLTHVNNDLSVHFFPSIQKQILDRVLRYVHTDAAGDVYLGSDENGIRLYVLDIKTQKSYDSLVLKLLHKVENVGADIFDRIGFRFVTYSKIEALQALSFLKQSFVFAFPNVKTSRSRNTLIDLEAFHNALERMIGMVERGEIDERDVYRLVAGFAESKECHPDIIRQALSERNLYSSTEYSSIQFTCRQLIRVQGPPITLPGVHNPNPGLVDYKFFFPYEVQILDKESYTESRKGRASHAEYKRAQIRAVRERVFPWLKASENSQVK